MFKMSNEWTSDIFVQQFIFVLVIIQFGFNHFRYRLVIVL